MGVWPIGRLLFSMSVPMMISMLVQALYNIIDSMFVARISEEALAAVSFAFPAQCLMIAVATGTRVGINAFLSKSLGEKNFTRANKIADNALFLALVSGGFFALFGLFFSHLFFTLQTDIPEIVEGGTKYLQICMIFSLGVMIQVNAEGILHSTGKAFHSMIVQITGALINIILDPLFIFGWLGFPKMGIAGAAVATVIGQWSAAILAILFNIFYNKEIHLSFKGFRPDWVIIKRIYLVGFPSIVLASIGSLMTFVFNSILIGFSTTAVAFFGVYFKLQSFIFMPLFGMNNGLVPVVAYNFGAGNPKRIRQAVKLSIVAAEVLMLIGLLIFQLFPQPLLKIFNASEALLGVGIPGLRIISLHFLMAGICIVTLSVFQAFSHGFLSLFIALVRQLIVLLPTAYLLSFSGKINNVWWAFPIAEVVSVALSLYFIRSIYRLEIIPLEKNKQLKSEI